MENHGTIKDPKLALAYILQPRKNTFTFQSARTGARYTFQVKPLDKEQAKQNGIKDMRFFVKFLCGQDNENDYRYLGQILNGVFSLTKKSRESGLSETTPAYIAFKTSFDALVAGRMPESLEVIHSGRCARCGRKLTVPQSVKDGFGPECIHLVNGAVAPCPLPELKPLSVVGKAVPAQGELYNALEQSIAKPAAKVNGTPAVQNVGELDMMIRARIAEYRREAPENYYHDGELDEKQAFNVAYNKFRVEIEQESK